MNLSTVERGATAWRDPIPDKVHILSLSALRRRTPAPSRHWEADLVIYNRVQPLLVLHERKTRLTLLTRLARKTAAETVAALMAMLCPFAPRMRASVTFDNDSCFTDHAALHPWLGATTCFCDAYASW